MARLEKQQATLSEVEKILIGFGLLEQFWEEAGRTSRRPSGTAALHFNEGMAQLRSVIQEWQDEAERK